MISYSFFFLLIAESDSEEEESQFYSASQSKRRKRSEPQSGHALSLLCLTVLIGKGRLQAMTDCKVIFRIFLKKQYGDFSGI